MHVIQFCITCITYIYLNYLLTLLVLLTPTFNANEKFLKNMPAAIGRPYYREERN